MIWENFWKNQSIKNQSLLNRFIWGLRNHLSIEYANTFSQYLSIEPKKILEVGCGSGSTLKILKNKYPSCHCVGVDISINAITLAQKDNNGCEFIIGDAFNLSTFQDFDLVYSIGLIEHFSRLNAQEIMSEKKNTLNKNGYLGVVVPIKNSPIDFTRQIMGNNWPYGFEDPFYISEINNFYESFNLYNYNKKIHYLSIGQWISNEK